MIGETVDVDLTFSCRTFSIQFGPFNIHRNLQCMESDNGMTTTPRPQELDFLFITLNNLLFKNCLIQYCIYLKFLIDPESDESNTNLSNELHHFLNKFLNMFKFCLLGCTVNTLLVVVEIGLSTKNCQMPHSGNDRYLCQQLVVNWNLPSTPPKNEALGPGSHS